MNRLTLIAATLAVGACSAEEPGRLPRSGEPVEVTVSMTRRAPATESFPAVVTSERTAEIATRMSGTVERVLVDVGATVRRGQALVALDANDVAARVAAARAHERLAQRYHRRVESLARDGAASQHELDQATAALEASSAARSEAEAQQAYAVVRAPFDGVVTRRSVDPGDLAAPGRPLLTLVAPGTLKVVADLPAHRAGTLPVGGSVRVRIQGAEARVATVTRVVPALGEGSRTFRVEATLSASGEGVLPGSYARLEVERTGEGPRWIPEDALIRRGQLTGVYAVEADKARLRWVRIGQSRDGALELLAGPAGALHVVRSPSPELFDGRTVRVVGTTPWTVPGFQVEDPRDAEVAQ